MNDVHVSRVLLMLCAWTTALNCFIQLCCLLQAWFEMPEEGILTEPDT